MTPATLEQRRAAIRLPKTVIAQAEGLHKQTVYEILTAGVHEPLNSTLNAIERAIRREELRLRDHLLRIHPIEPAASDGPPTIERLERMADELSQTARELARLADDGGRADEERA
jgi:transcriptional regulator with XRE-family HTH domain